MSKSSQAGAVAPRRVGVWLIGARGAISSCVAYGLAGIREGLLEPVGLVSEQSVFRQLPLVDLDALVLGGCDVCRRPMTQSAGELVRGRVLPADLVAAVSSQAASFEARLRPGLLDQTDVGLADLDPEAARLGALGVRQQIEHVQNDLRAFQSEHQLERVIVVHLASTEILHTPSPDWEDLGRLERALDRGVSQPASVLYAYAALSQGHAYINFTPSAGSAIPALMQLARERTVAHCGNDGKTGETLIKTVLAPMFVARNLRVLSWQGYNMLGNRDGEVLADPLHREAKLRSKGDALRSILKDPRLHHQVAIDYVPSLRDWKTAWDFVHFEGFLGAQMSLQFTWQGSDSALAAPLVLDLVRFTELAQRRGEGGVMPHVASFFKAPMGATSHDFYEQYRMLLEYARR